MGAIVVLWALQDATSHRAPVLLPIANFLFLTLTSAVVAFLVGRTFVARRVPALLLVGCANVIFGVSGFLAPLLHPHQPNGQVTIYNTAVFAAALIHLVTSLNPRLATTPLRRRKISLLGGYSLALGLVAAIALSVGFELTPPFFIPGSGPTVLRQLVLGAAIAMFGITAALLLTRRSETAFSRWYALALCLLAIGLFGVMIQPAHDTWLSWVSRATQWLGGFYMLLAAKASMGEARAWGVSIEEALVEAQKRTETLLETISDGFLAMDNSWRVTYVNRAGEKLLGRSRSELQGKRYFDVYPEGLARRFREECSKASTGRIAVEFEEYYGEPLNRWFECRAYPAAEGVSVLFRDITEERTARERAFISEQRFREAVENAPNAYVIYDAQRRVQYLNSAAARVGGRPVSEILGKRDEEIWPENVTRLYLPVLLEAWKERATRRAEVTVHLPTTGSHTQILTFVPLLDGQGEIREMLAIGFDITERKHAEQAVLDAQAQLQAHAQQLEDTVAHRTESLRETVAELEHYSYAIAHDMRAPLRAMRGYAEVILEEGIEGRTQEVSDYLERIQRAAHRMDQLITGALNYSKASQQRLSLSTIDLAEMLRSLIETYPNLRPEQATIELGGIPSVLGDEAALTQCFSNLLGNAVKFVAPGTRPHIRVWSERRGSMVRVWVEDNGIGIPEHLQTQLFKLFTRVNTSHEGTGIGLAVVKKVVHRMGGQVGVESRPDAGSRFWVELKAAQPAGSC